ncbi:MAG: DUF2071 domain-containing protein [Myxococcaceae bacterium]
MELGYQRWDDILFLHWEVPAELLRRRVDPRLEIDSFEGRSFVSLTPFTLMNARMRFLPPLPGLSYFHELNFRTYVSHQGVSGIWFFSLDAASPVASAIARSTFGLPYYPARIRRTRAGDERRYQMTRGRPGRTVSCDMSWSPGRELGESSVGSLEAFLVERYALFSRAPYGGLLRVDVRHPAWPLREALGVRLNQTLSAAHGLPGPSDGLIAHASPGVDVAFVRIGQVEVPELRIRRRPRPAHA